MGGVTPSHAYSTLLGRRRDGPRLTASRNGVKHHICLKEVFGGGGGAVIGHFDEDSRSETDSLTGGNDEAWFLHEFDRLPLRVAGDGLVQPLVGDRGAVRVSGRHKRELEERCRSSVEHLNVYRVDFLELLDQNCMVVGI